MARNTGERQRTFWTALAIAWSAWSSNNFATANEPGAAPTACQDKRCRQGCIGHQSENKVQGAGPLGYGPPGIFPGFQGFGLGYHLGYGYGGNALGTPDGGYPFYSGPGYPHPAPPLRRIGGINPFPHYGGAGFPTPDQPNFYGQTGPLIVDKPVVELDGGHDAPNMATSYGSFTGALPYADSAFAPFTSEASGAKLEMNPTGDSPRVIPAPDRKPGEPLHPSSRNDLRPGSIPSDRDLGFDQEVVTGSNQRRRIKVSHVYAGGEAEKSGLQTGDLIESINDYTNTAPGNLSWIILNAAPDRMLRMKVHGKNDNSERTVIIPLDQSLAGGRIADETAIR